MDYQEFAKGKTVLYGQITVGGKSKVGSFKAEWQHLTNSLVYSYYSPAGHKGKGAFTLPRAYVLFTKGRLSIDPANGDPKNYL